MNRKEQKTIQQKLFEKQVQEIAAKTENVVCDCGCEAFVQFSIVKQISKFLINSQRDLIWTSPQLFCAKCYKLFKPKENLIQTPDRRLV